MYQAYKPVGKTPLEIVKQYKKELGIDGKMAYSGRLDPMAHGFLVLLTGDELKKMEAYNAKDKKYRFRMLIGISTDTTDVLGLINSKMDQISEEQVDITVDHANTFNETSYDQEYHIYSSMGVKGPDGKKKALWELANAGQLDGIQIPTKKVSIYSFEETTRYQITSQTLEEQIMDNLNALTDGSKFRVDEIKQRWKQYFDNIDNDKFYHVIQFDANVSSGTYIRQLVKDIGKKAGVPTMVIEIYRYPFENLKVD